MPVTGNVLIKKHEINNNKITTIYIMPTSEPTSDTWIFNECNYSTK